MVLFSDVKYLLGEFTALLGECRKNVGEKLNQLTIDS
jgi:hypothetical protein